ncbi:MAG: copper resistance CopC family protein [Gemmatimonadales bacterium]
MRTMFLLAAVFGTATVPHAGLKSSSPAKGSTVIAPKEISLTFTEGVNLLATSIAILKADSTLVEKLHVRFTAGDTTVAGPVTRPLPPGTYLIKWRNGSADDGHVSSGTFSFHVVGH